MANPTSQAYEGGNKVVAGAVTTDMKNLAADTYYLGMRLEYQADGTPVTAGTGNGVASAVTGGPGVISGAWVFTFTAALVGDLVDPNGTVIAQNVTITDGGAATFLIAGLTFTITDGSTAFVATDTITMTIEAAGEFSAIDEGVLAGIYNGPETVLSSAGYGSVITSGEIYEGGLVDDSDSALTITEFMRVAYRSLGFYLRRSA